MCLGLVVAGLPVLVLPIAYVAMGRVADPVPNVRHERLLHELLHLAVNTVHPSADGLERIRDHTREATTRTSTPADAAAEADQAPTT